MLLSANGCLLNQLFENPIIKNAAYFLCKEDVQKYQLPKFSSVT